MTSLLLCIRVHLYIQAGCVLLSAAPSVGSVCSYLFLWLFFFLVNVQEKFILKKVIIVAAPRKTILNGFFPLDVLNGSTRFIRLHVCVCVYMFCLICPIISGGPSALNSHLYPCQDKLETLDKPANQVL